MAEILICFLLCIPFTIHSKNLATNYIIIKICLKNYYFSEKNLPRLHITTRPIFWTKPNRQLFYYDVN